MERKAFTFLRSFYEAACEIKDKTLRADFFMAICNYALNGEEPECTGEVKALFILIKPVLDVSQIRSECGAIGGRKNKKRTNNKAEASNNQTESQKEARKVREKELIIFQRNKSKARIASKNTDYNEYIESVKGKENKLSMKHKLLLSKTPKKLSWCLMKAKKVDITDLPALTAATGDEFAIFEKGKHRILLRGSGPNWEIPDDLWETIVKEKWRWNGHSHPVKGKAIASSEDRKTLRLLTWQNESYIINLQGEIFEFNPDEQDWFNTILGVK